MENSTKAQDEQVLAAVLKFKTDLSGFDVPKLWAIFERELLYRSIYVQSQAIEPNVEATSGAFTEIPDKSIIVGKRIGLLVEELQEIMSNTQK